MLSISLQRYVKLANLKYKKTIINIVTADHMSKMKSNEIRLYFVCVWVLYFKNTMSYQTIAMQDHFYHHSLLRLVSNRLKGGG